MGTPDQSMWAPVGRPDLQGFVPRERRVAPLVVWLLSLAAALAALLWLGRGVLVAPDLTDPSSWGDWAAARGTAITVVASLRIVALGLAWYLVGVTSVSLLAHAARAARLVRLADVLAVGPVRAVVQQALGVSLAVGVVATQLPAASLGGLDASPPAATTGIVARAASGAETIASPPVPGPPTGHSSGSTSSPVPPPAPGVHGAAPVPGDERPAVTVAGDARPAGATPAIREVRVAPGDHLWGIAEADLRAVLDRSPTEQEVAAHWQRLVRLNTERLVVPTNPDLLHPGQLVALPPVEVAS